MHSEIRLKNQDKIFVSKAKKIVPISKPGYETAKFGYTYEFRR